MRSHPGAPHMPAFLISLREGLEAALIVGILLGALRRLDEHHLARYVWLGVLAAAIVSLVVAVGLSAAGIEFEGRGEAIFEGVTFILAASLLTGMMFWMRRHGGELRTTLEAGARRAAESAANGKVARGFRGRRLAVVCRRLHRSRTRGHRAGSVARRHYFRSLGSESRLRRASRCCRRRTPRRAAVCWGCKAQPGLFLPA